MKTYALDAGRCIVIDGTPLATIHGVGNYDPCEVDALARKIVSLLQLDADKKAKRGPSPELVIKQSALQE